MLKHKINRTIGIIILIAISMFAITSCKSPSGVDIVATVTINNACGAAVEIYMDGIFRFILATGLSQAIENVAEGAHLLDAWKEGTEILVNSDGFNISSSGGYNWDIPGPSRIVITNNYGETLSIYLNGDLLGTLDNTFSEGVNEITFGQHNLEAKKNDNSTAATFTIDVTDVGEFFWEILQ
ncbi:hypothetical protein ACFLT9_05590 [Acidobacteriota bacterium]